MNKYSHTCSNKYVSMVATLSVPDVYNPSTVSVWIAERRKALVASIDLPLVQSHSATAHSGAIHCRITQGDTLHTTLNQNSRNCQTYTNTIFNKHIVQWLVYTCSSEKQNLVRVDNQQSKDWVSEENNMVSHSRVWIRGYENITHLLPPVSTTVANNIFGSYRKSWIFRYQNIFGQPGLCQN